MITKKELDKLVKQYETKDFIKDDPIQFMHMYKDKRDVELAGFISSIFAYGNRKVFIKKLYELFSIMENKPLEYIKGADFSDLKGFDYRFAKENDIIQVFKILSKLYDNSNLEELFKYGYQQFHSIIGMLQVVVDYFYSNVSEDVGTGFYHLIPNPKNGGAMKRMNMYLRWNVRRSPVDFGIWDFIDSSELLIPLDVHVANISRKMGLLTRKSNDYKAVLELTNNLKKYCKEDPVKYDFAMFAYDIDKKKEG